MPMSASRSARRAAAVTLAASSLLFAAACGGSDSKSDKAADKDTAKSSAPSASAPGAAGGTVSEAQLKAALLTTKDVPAGWKVDPEGGSTMGKADKTECQKFLDIVQSEPAPLGAAARQTVNFEDGGQQVFGFDGDKAAGYLKGFDASLAQCASFGVEVDGQKYPATLKPLTLDKAGDEAHGYQLVLDLTQVKMAFDNYVVRKGAALSTFSTKSKTPGGAAGAEFKTITATVAKKLDQAVKG